MPGTDGKFGVLRSHAPLGARWNGRVRIESRRQDYVGNCGGFSSSHQRSVYWPFAESLPKYRERALESERRARSRLEGKLDEEHMQRDRAEAALKRAQIRLKLAGR